jgi:hypothetical protein
MKMTSGLLRRVVWLNFTDVSEVLAAAARLTHHLMVEAVSTSEASVNFYQTTWRNEPEDSHLPTA